MGTARNETNTVSLEFSRADQSAPDTARAAALYGSNVPVSGRADSRECAPYKEKTTLSGTLADVFELAYVAVLESKDSISVSEYGNVNPFPFRRRRATAIACTAAPFRTELSYALGPTDPCSSAVHMEPFSTSAFKVLV